MRPEDICIGTIRSELNEGFIYPKVKQCMAIPNVDINYLAVLVSAVVSIILGSLWYSPLLFGKVWMRLAGKNAKEMNKAKKRGMGKLYLVAFIASLVMAYVLAHFIKYLTATSFTDGMLAGFWLWLGFIAAVQIGIVIWDNKPFKLYLLNAIYYLVSLAIMGGILAVWK